MFKTYYCFGYLILLLFTWNTALAQITIRLANTDYTIPNFNTNTLTNREAFIAEDSILKRYKYIKPIKSAHSEFEVRCYYKSDFVLENFRMIILKGTKHRLWVEDYLLSYVYILVNNAPGIKPNDQSSIRIKINRHHVKNPNLVMTQLIRLGLFNYAGNHIGFRDQEQLDTTIAQNDAQSLRVKVVFEVKLNSLYRSFSYASKYKPHSTDLEVLYDGKEIFDAFQDLISKRR